MLLVCRPCRCTNEVRNIDRRSDCMNMMDRSSLPSNKWSSLYRGS